MLTNKIISSEELAPSLQKLKEVICFAINASFVSGEVAPDDILNLLANIYAKSAVSLGVTPLLAKQAVAMAVDFHELEKEKAKCQKS